MVLGVAGEGELLGGLVHHDERDQRHQHHHAEGGDHGDARLVAFGEAVADAGEERGLGRGHVFVPAYSTLRTWTRVVMVVDGLVGVTRVVSEMPTDAMARRSAELVTGAGISVPLAR